MKQPRLLIFFSTFFLFGLLIFRAIFPALILTSVIFLASVVFEIVWYYKDSAPFLILIKPAVNFFVSASLALSCYIFLYLPVEFLLTEVLIKFAKIPQLVGTAVLVILAVGFSLVDWKKRLIKRSSWSLLFLFCVVSGLVYLVYRNEKLQREYLPKIFHVSPNWAIQRQLVKIEGLNFGHSFQKGTVVIGQEKMIIVTWSDNFILAEQPVPAGFAVSQLKVIKGNGVISNGIPFEIRNPDSLKN